MAFEIFLLLKKIRNLHCPECNVKIKKENIQMANNTFNCHDCEYSTSISDAISPQKTASQPNTFNKFSKPKGTWERNEFNKTTIGVSKRSSMAFFFVPFSIFWTSGALSSLIIPLISEETIDLDQSLLSIPFLIISIFLVYFALSSVFGKIEVSYNFRGGEIFTGIGEMGRTKNFQWYEITSISDEKTNYRVNNKIQYCIKIQGKNNITFATGLQPDKRHYLLNKLQQLHKSHT